MRGVRAPSIGLGLLVVTACYGGFDNSIFADAGLGAPDGGSALPDGGATVTVVSGTIDRAPDAELGWVGVVGRPEFAVVPDADGTFTLDGVPAGPVTLAATDGVARAARLDLPARDLRVPSLTLVLAEAGAIRGTVRWNDGSPARAVPLRLLEYPVTTRTTPDGILEITAVPPGCVTLVSELPGRGELSQQVCLAAGGTSRIDLVLSAPPPADTRPCEPCVVAADCPDGTECVTRRFGTATERICAVRCQRPADCAEHESCEALGAGAKACVPARASCAALMDRLDRRQCRFRANCGLGGRANDGGRCVDGRCTVACESGGGCPDGAACLPGSVCE